MQSWMAILYLEKPTIQYWIEAAISLCIQYYCRGSQAGHVNFHVRDGLLEKTERFKGGKEGREV